MDPEKFEADFNPLSVTTCASACVHQKFKRERERAGVRDSLESNNLSVYNGKSKNGSALK